MPLENSTVNTPNPLAPSAVAAARKALRAAAIAARESLPDNERARLSAHIESHLETLMARLAPRCLAFCWPWRGEVDLVPWMRRWLAADPTRAAALPMVAEAARPMRFLRWRPGDRMDVDHHGIPVPATGERVEPDVILVPLNAFDGAGYRLGYGGGYFDRTLAAMRPAPVCVGVAFELARTASIHPQAHDRPMDWIVTEAGSFPAAPGPDAASFSG